MKNSLLFFIKTSFLRKEARCFSGLLYCLSLSRSLVTQVSVFNGVYNRRLFPRSDSRPKNRCASCRNRFPRQKEHPAHRKTKGHCRQSKIPCPRYYRRRRQCGCRWRQSGRIAVRYRDGPPAFVPESECRAWL